MEKIKKYIDGLNTDGIKPASASQYDGNIETDEEFAARKARTTINVDPSGMIEALQRLQTSSEANRAFLEAHARLGIQQALVKHNPALAGFIGVMHEDAQNAMYIEYCRQAYGNELVDKALAQAQRSTRSFYHCVQVLLIDRAMGSTMARLREAFENVSQFVDETLGNNRHDRRSRKHAKRIKEGDQQWARRTRRKYRR